MATIRSTVTPDGQRLFLNETAAGGFQVETRWVRIGRPFVSINDAIEAFEVLEFCEGDLSSVYRRSVAVEIRRTPKSAVVGSAMARTWHVLAGTEKREAGLRPVACGRKSANIRWIRA